MRNAPSENRCLSCRLHQVECASMSDVLEPADGPDRSASAPVAVGEKSSPTAAHGGLEGMLPVAPTLILDVGAGTGQGAA
jgi:hypothetical protein